MLPRPEGAGEHKSGLCHMNLQFCREGGRAVQPTRTLREFFKKGDVLLLALCVLASLMGLALIYSATRYDPDLHSYAQKHIIFLGMGVVAYVWVTFIDIEYLMEKW